MKNERIVLGGTLLLIGVAACGIAAVGFRGASDQQEEPLPPVIRSASSVGEVAFPHQFHFEELGMECRTCHHETNASFLRMPHEEYFDDFWIDCLICHGKEASAVLQPHSCSACHHDSPADIADETLSTKVVVHKKCWECHEVGKGEEASRSCTFCHLQSPG